MKTISKNLLDEITQRLVAELKPEKIILFGSHAWGQPNDDSDLDMSIRAVGIAGGSSSIARHRSRSAKQKKTL